MGPGECRRDSYREQDWDPQTLLGQGRALNPAPISGGFLALTLGGPRRALHEAKDTSLVPQGTV